MSRRFRKFYKRKAWRKLREMKLTADPFCECPHCKADGLKIPASVVDHIRPVSAGGSMWEWDNLQSLAWS